MRSRELNILWEDDLFSFLEEVDGISSARFRHNRLAHGIWHSFSERRHRSMKVATAKLSLTHRKRAHPPCGP